MLALRSRCRTGEYDFFTKSLKAFWLALRANGGARLSDDKLRVHERTLLFSITDAIAEKYNFYNFVVAVEERF